MLPVFSRPRIVRGTLPARRMPVARVAPPVLRRGAVPRLLPAPARRSRLPSQPVRPTLLVRAPEALPVASGPLPHTSPLGAWQGPNPYGNFRRSFTDAGGIKLTFAVPDTNVWRTAFRVVLWLLAMAATLWFAAKVSPYPLVPRGCQLFAPCAASVPPLQFGANLALLAAMAVLYAWLLFADEQRLASIEIRPDCMIVDNTDVFWLCHMELGWPELRSDIDSGGMVLRGVYGTRQIDYLTLQAIDDNDRTIAVLATHLRFAMQQLWDQPGG